jgi:hypothetical protein
MKKLKAGEAVPFPLSRGSRMLGTYYNPCKSIGLLADGTVKGGLPYLITERGEALWSARHKLLADSPLLQVLSSSNVLTPEAANFAVHHFSLSSLDASGAEARLLRDAFQKPWRAAPVHAGTVTARYMRFMETCEWINARILEGPGPANRILSRNLRTCSIATKSGAASVAWAEYEWRRRQHYALELLLSSVCGLLKQAGDLSIDGILRVARGQTEQSNELAELWPDAKLAWRGTAREAAISVPPDLMEGQPLPFVSVNQLRAAQQMLGAFAILAALESQTRRFRTCALDRTHTSVSDLALKLVLNADDRPFETLLRALVETCAVLPHLQITLRKMSNGQKCSLRFFPDGNLLRLTANQSGAGFSASRLDNTLGILVDIGVLRRKADGTLATVEAA